MDTEKERQLKEQARGNCIVEGCRERALKTRIYNREYQRERHNRKRRNLNSQSYKGSPLLP